MWWAGYSSPARFLTPILLPLAIPLGVWFASTRSLAARMLGVSAVVVSLLITVTIVSVERGALLFNSRDGASRLLLWMSPLVNVTTGMPSLFQNAPIAAVARILGGYWLSLTAAAALFAGARNLKSPVVILVSGIGGAVSNARALCRLAKQQGDTDDSQRQRGAQRHFPPRLDRVGVRIAFRVLAASDVVPPRRASSGQHGATAQ